MKIDWQLANKSSVNKKSLAEVVKIILEEKGIKGKVELGISIVGDKEMMELNERHMKKTGTTDVLSFPLEKEKGPDGITRLGDVVVNFEQAEKQAREKKVDIEKEVKFLLKHGLRHLLGIHHN